MRRLAREQSVTPMALYRHFVDKEQLLDAMVELAFADAEFTDLAWYSDTLDPDQFPNIRAALESLTASPSTDDYCRLGIDMTVGGIRAIADELDENAAPVVGAAPITAVSAATACQVRIDVGAHSPLPAGPGRTCAYDPCVHPIA